MLRFFLLRFVLPLLLFLIVRSVLKTVWGSWSSSVTPRPGGGRTADAPTGGELKKDPVCGVYVAPETSVTKTVGGRQLYFCSVACRDKYHAA
jgi:YHS domain-containing protein